LGPQRAALPAEGSADPGTTTAARPEAAISTGGQCLGGGAGCDVGSVAAVLTTCSVGSTTSDASPSMSLSADIGGDAEVVVGSGANCWTWKSRRAFIVFSSTRIRSNLGESDLVKMVVVVGSTAPAMTAMRRDGSGTKSIRTSYSKIDLVLTLPQEALSSSRIYSSCLPSNDTPPLLI
jgi:hypothetical protein